MSNKSQSLLDIFQEILAASGGNASASGSINETQILSVLREQANTNSNFDSLLVRVLKEAQSKLNLTLNTETCGYCDGDFREVIQAYNGIHGYVSLLVRAYVYLYYLQCCILAVARRSR